MTSRLGIDLGSSGRSRTHGPRESSTGQRTASLGSLRRSVGCTRNTSTSSWRAPANSLAFTVARSWLVAVVSIALMTACAPDSTEKGASENDAGTDTPTVVVSVLPQAYLVERIGGPHVEVDVMIPPGASPHLYEPSIRQMQSVANADIYIKVGHPSFPFERTWLARMLEANEHLTVVDSSRDIEHLAEDPHIWVAPGTVRVMARNVADALARAYPEHASDFNAGLQSFLADVAVVDRKLSQVLAPHRGRSFFVFHPAWGYFAEEYGLVQSSIEHEHKEPSAGHVSRMIDEVRDSGASVIFVQPQFARQSAEAIARELGVEVAVLDPLARDWVANMNAVAEALGQAFAHTRSTGEAG